MVSAEAKVTKSGEEMVLVRLMKTLENENGVVLIDTRYFSNNCSSVRKAVLTKHLFQKLGISSGICKASVSFTDAKGSPSSRRYLTPYHKTRRKSNWHRQTDTGF